MPAGSRISKHHSCFHRSRCGS